MDLPGVPVELMSKYYLDIAMWKNWSKDISFTNVDEIEDEGLREEVVGLLSGWLERRRG